MEKRYKKRADHLEGVSLYDYVARHWRSDGKLTCPNFFGYHDRPTWPLNETYSKWMLTFYVPWRNSVDELKSADGTFATALESHMNDENFPEPTKAEIMRAKRNDRGVDLSEAAGLIGDTNFTPTDSRRDALNDAAADAALSPGDADNGNDESEFQDMSDELFDRLDPRIPENHDWSLGYDASLVAKLVEYAKKFYDSRRAATIRQMLGGNEDLVELFKEELFRPEKAQSEEQKFLIFHHLLVHYNFKMHEANPIEHPLPPMENVFVEGKPGVGKSWVSNTIRNITRAVRKCNLADKATAPTGCSASIIRGSTHHRSIGVPTGKKFKGSPSNMETTHLDKLRAMRIELSKVFTYIKDEHSMDGRATWGWIRHRFEEFRGPAQAIDDDLVQLSSVGDLPPEVHNRPFGGVPTTISLGDSHQLPPVMMKALHDQAPAKAGSSDQVGKVAFADFINPPDTSVANSTVVLMDHVFHQDDEHFLGFLDRVRQGDLTDDDVDFLLSKRLDRIRGTPEGDLFDDALHLVPQWKQAHKLNFDYLKNSFNTPIAKMRAKLSNTRTDGRNCCVQESSLPMKSALCVGAVVMCLHNFIVEHGIMNGSVGVVTQICFSNSSGASDGTEYVIVDFPNCSVPEDDALIPGMPPTCVPIPVVEVRCEKKCCSIAVIPLLVCKALTGHKAQGMTVGSGEQFKRLVVHLPTKGMRSVAGWELVAISRVKSPDLFAIGNATNQLDRQTIKKIGKGLACDRTREFLQSLEAVAATSQQRTKVAITNLDQSENKTFQGGCDFLLNWYRTNFFDQST